MLAVFIVNQWETAYMEPVNGSPWMSIVTDCRSTCDDCKESANDWAHNDPPSKRPCMGIVSLQLPD
jgi:hypothetical protein